MSHQRYFIVREVVLGTSSVRMHDNGLTLLNMDTAGMCLQQGGTVGQIAHQNRHGLEERSRGSSKTGLSSSFLVQTMEAADYFYA